MITYNEDGKTICEFINHESFKKFLLEKVHLPKEVSALTSAILTDITSFSVGSTPIKVEEEFIKGFTVALESLQNKPDLLDVKKTYIETAAKVLKSGFVAKHFSEEIKQIRENKLDNKRK